MMFVYMNENMKLQLWSEMFVISKMLFSETAFANIWVTLYNNACYYLFSCHNASDPCRFWVRLNLFKYTYFLSCDLMPKLECYRQQGYQNYVRYCCFIRYSYHHNYILIHWHSLFGCLWVVNVCAQYSCIYTL
jgi:hypothetical protein